MKILKGIIILVLLLFINSCIDYGFTSDRDLEDFVGKWELARVVEPGFDTTLSGVFSYEFFDDYTCEIIDLTDGDTLIYDTEFNFGIDLNVDWYSFEIYSLTKKKMVLGGTRIGGFYSPEGQLRGHFIRVD